MLKSKLKPLLYSAMFSALTAVFSQILIPLPAVPINLALFAVLICGYLLGPKYGTLSAAIYVAAGAAGLPVFAGFQGGLGVLFGKTGGFIFSFLIIPLIVGSISKNAGSIPRIIISMIPAVLCCYLCGTFWFVYLTEMPFSAALTYCVLPFIAGDVIKIGLAALIGTKLKRLVAFYE